MLLASLHPRLADGLRGLMEASFESVFIVADSHSLRRGARTLQPALMVIDLTLAEGRLDALLTDLRRLAPQSRTLLLSDYDDPGADAAALDAGAAGVLHKTTLAADLSSAVDAVLAGQRYLPPPLAH